MSVGVFGIGAPICSRNSPKANHESARILSISCSFRYTTWETVAVIARPNAMAR